LKGAKIDLKALAAGQDCEFEINEKEDYLGTIFLKIVSFLLNKQN
jgi:hypothetical protein